MHLYDEIGEQVAEKLDGDFAFVILDEKKDEIYAARDPIGVASMYIGWGADGSVWFASEMKCLLQDCRKVRKMRNPFVVTFLCVFLAATLPVFVGMVLFCQ